MNLAIENLISLNSPVGSARKSYHHCNRVQQPMEHKYLPTSTLAVGRQLGMYLFAQANDTETVQEEKLFSFESESYVLHTFFLSVSHESYQGLL